jgi:hypothetical protein
MIYEFSKNLRPFTKTLKIREEGEFLIASSDSLEICYLNPVAKDFFYLIDGERTVEEIIRELLDMYDTDMETLKKDILLLIRDLQWKDIIGLKKSN